MDGWINHQTESAQKCLGSTIGDGDAVNYTVKVSEIDSSSCGILGIVR